MKALANPAVRIGCTVLVALVALLVIAHLSH
jgi:hypothetical protein